MNQLVLSRAEFEAAGGWERAFTWALGKYENVIRLGHYGEAYPFGTFPKMLGAGARRKVQASLENLHDPLVARLELEPGGWWLGYISYDAGRAFHTYPDLGLPRLDSGVAWEFICPEVLIWERGDEVVIEGEHTGWILSHIAQAQFPLPVGEGARGWGSTSAKDWLTQSLYHQKINSIKKLLEAGDIYEMNFCRPVEVPGGQDMAAVYLRLAEASPMPFQFYVKTKALEMAGSSPERFLKKIGDRLISQPIKGTAPRGATPEEDRAQLHHLQNDEKTIAENMMITDLVRNDLMRVCLSGSVQVDEVFGAYTFRNLHQLITTVSGTLPEGVDLWQILAATFPMGSMTGAPKQAVLGYIEQHEVLARGPFSGAVGWVAPNGDFDFSVVIRSLYQNPQTGRCWLNTGGAIVWDSDAQAEFEEAELKAAAIRSVIR